MLDFDYFKKLFSAPLESYRKALKKDRELRERLRPEIYEAYRKTLIDMYHSLVSETGIINLQSKSLFFNPDEIEKTPTSILVKIVKTLRRFRERKPDLEGRMNFSLN